MMVFLPGNLSGFLNFQDFPGFSRIFQDFPGLSSNLQILMVLTIFLQIIDSLFIKYDMMIFFSGSYPVLGFSVYF